MEYMFTDLERHELLIHLVEMNAQVILWLWGVNEKVRMKRELGTLGLLPNVLELGRECMHSFILQIFIQLLLCQALGIQK